MTAWKFDKDVDFEDLDLCRFHFCTEMIGALYQSVHEGYELGFVLSYVKIHRVETRWLRRGILVETNTVAHSRCGAQW